jgi:hypothetical protein
MHFAPAGDEVNSLIYYFNNTYPSFRTINIYIHKNEKAGVKYILTHLEETTLALIVLRQITPSKVNYVIRQNYTTLPNSNLIIQRVSTGLFIDYQQYLLSGYLSIQKGVDEWVFNYTNAIYSIKYNNNNTTQISKLCNGPPQVVLIPYPTSSYEANPFFLNVGFLLGLAMVMATLYPVSRLMKSIVEEKELKLREIMKIMGLLDWAHQISWFLSAFILFLWIAISCTFLTKISFLKYSSPILLFAYFFLFTMSEINFAFLLSTFFSNSKLAAIVGPVALFSALLPRFIFLNTNYNEEVSGKIIASFLSPTAFAFGADIISQFEYGNVGIQFSNLTIGKYNFQTVLTMMFIDFIIYGILAWYFDKILPHEHGTVENPLFVFNWRYWCPKNRLSEGTKSDLSETLVGMPEFYDTIGTENDVVIDNDNDNDDNNNDNIDNIQNKRVIYHAIHNGDNIEVAMHGHHHHQDGNVESTDGRHNHNHPYHAKYNSSIESIPFDLRTKAKVRCRMLRKRYHDGNLAVKDLSMSMLEGQITCLLGHNGAGKYLSNFLIDIISMMCLLYDKLNKMVWYDVI